MSLVPDAAIASVRPSGEKAALVSRSPGDRQRLPPQWGGRRDVGDVPELERVVAATGDQGPAVRGGDRHQIRVSGLEFEAAERADCVGV